MAELPVTTQWEAFFVATSDDQAVSSGYFSGWPQPDLEELGLRQSMAVISKQVFSGIPQVRCPDCGGPLFPQNSAEHNTLCQSTQHQMPKLFSAGPSSPPLPEDAI